MKHLGDFDLSTVVYGKFTSYRPTTGATFTLGGTPVLSVYKDNSTAQSTTGVALTADFDSVTGLNHFAIDTSADGTFYSTGSFFDIVITTGTVDSVSVTGTVVGSFTIRKTASLKPTTAGRTIDVSAGGEAGIDWANIGSPTTAVNLSATNIDVDQVVASVSGAVGSVTGAVGSVTGAVGSVTAIVTANITQISGDSTAADNAEAFFDGTGYAGTNNVIPTVTAVTGLTNSTIADQVWDEVLAGHLTAGTTGNALNAAGAAGDPWTTALPGAYGAGTAGKLIGDNIDATISSRATQTSVDDVPTAAENAAAVWSEPGGPAVDGSYGTLVLAVRAKTDNLPASPAAVGDIPSAGQNAAAVWDESLAIHTTAGSAGKIVSDIPTAIQNADALLGRNVAGGSSSGRVVSQALYALRNKWTSVAGTYSVYGTDDTTVSWTSTLATDAAAEPLIGSDPVG